MSTENQTELLPCPVCKRLPYTVGSRYDEGIGVSKLYRHECLPATFTKDQWNKRVASSVSDHGQPVAASVNPKANESLVTEIAEKATSEIMIGHTSIRYEFTRSKIIQAINSALLTRDREVEPARINELWNHASILQDTLDLNVDEFLRIQAAPGVTHEIVDLCARAIKRTKQNVPVITQRDNAEKLVCELRKALEEQADYLVKMHTDVSFWKDKTVSIIRPFPNFIHAHHAILAALALSNDKPTGVPEPGDVLA